MSINDKVIYNKKIGCIVDIKKDIFGDNVYCVVLENKQKIWAYSEFIKPLRMKRANWNRDAIKEKKNNKYLQDKINFFCDVLKKDLTNK